MFFSEADYEASHTESPVKLPFDVVSVASAENKGG
jgi:hypothetical protein